MIADLIAAADVAAARRLIADCGLAFEPGYDDLVGVHEQGSLVAVGARAGRVLKMLTIAPAQRGGPLLGEIVSTLVARGIAAGCDGLFVFTKPGYAGSFEALNFTLLASQEQTVLLEFGNALKHWLAAHSHWRRPGINGALMVNGSPFARDLHRRVANTARQVDHLYVCVGADEPAPQPFPDRGRLLGERLRDLANVVVLDLGHYRIGAAGFPTYFLKADAPVATIRAELDATLFATRIAPFFGIARRYTHGEPTADDAAATPVLRAHGIEVSEIPNPDGAPRRYPSPGDSQ